MPARFFELASVKAIFAFSGLRFECEVYVKVADTILPCQYQEVGDFSLIDNCIKLDSELLTAHLHHGQRVPHWHVEQQVLVVLSILYNMSHVQSGAVQ